MEQELLTTLLSICLGLGLAAATGFRLFIPLLVVSIASHTGYLALSPSFDWLAGTPALIALAAATALEIAAYYVPWLDNLLDTVASPAAVVAGAVITASVVTGMDPFLRWTLAVIAGGGIAGAVQALTVGTRKVSALTTGGLGNPVVSSLEMGSSLGLSLVSIFWPFLAALAVAIFLFVSGRWFLRRRREREVAA